MAMVSYNMTLSVGWAGDIFELCQKDSLSMRWLESSLKEQCILPSKRFILLFNLSCILPCQFQIIPMLHQNFAPIWRECFELVSNSLTLWFNTRHTAWWPKIDYILMNSLCYSIGYYFGVSSFPGVSQCVDFQCCQRWILLLFPILLPLPEEQTEVSFEQTRELWVCAALAGQRLLQNTQKTVFT